MTQTSSKKKRQPVDAWVWNIFVEACGSRCGVCGEAGVPLERGHRISQANGGTDSYDNLIPVCTPCNKRYLKKETPDNYRPDDYLERFYLLLGSTLRPQISVNTADGLSRLIAGNEPAQNKQVISWQTPQNAPGLEVFTQSSDMTRCEAETLVRNMVYWARKNKEPRPNQPFPEAATGLIRLAMKHGRETWKIAVDAFLRDEPWRISGTDAGVHHDSWAAIANDFGFAHYLRLGREAIAARKAAEKRQHDAEVKTLWERYKRAGECGDWPGMTDAERAFRDKAKDETEVRELTDAELSYATDMPYKEFMVKRRRCLDFLMLCGQMIEANQYETGCADDVALLIERMQEVKTTKALHELHEGIQELYRQLLQCLAPGPGPDAF
jgi:hypothetical protein